MVWVSATLDEVTVVEEDEVVSNATSKESRSITTDPWNELLDNPGMLSPAPNAASFFFLVTHVLCALCAFVVASRAGQGGEQWEDVHVDEAGGRLRCSQRKIAHIQQVDSHFRSGCSRLASTFICKPPPRYVLIALCCSDFIEKLLAQQGRSTLRLDGLSCFLCS